MSQDHSCSDDAVSRAVLVAKKTTYELERADTPSFLATDDALAVFAQILEMSDEEVSQILESQKVGL